MDDTVYEAFYVFRKEKKTNQTDNSSVSKELICVLKNERIMNLATSLAASNWGDDETRY